MAKKTIKEEVKENAKPEIAMKVPVSKVTNPKSANTKENAKKDTLPASDKAISSIKVESEKSKVESNSEIKVEKVAAKSIPAEPIKTPAKKVVIMDAEDVDDEPMPVELKAPYKAASNKDEPIVPRPAPPGLRFSDEDLDMFAGVINEAKHEALEELRMLKERLEDLTSFDAGEESMIYSMHMAEQGSEAQEKEKTYAQIQRISEHIKKLEDAMDRIKNKSYGICRVCGCLIAKERLLAVPVTTLSAAYKIHSKCPDDGFDRIEPVKK